MEVILAVGVVYTAVGIVASWWLRPINDDERRAATDMISASFVKYGAAPGRKVAIVMLFTSMALLWPLAVYAYKTKYGQNKEDN